MLYIHTAYASYALPAVLDCMGVLAPLCAADTLPMFPALCLQCSRTARSSLSLQLYDFTPANTPQRETLLSQLTRSLDSEPTASSLKTSNLARHRDIHSEHTREFSRLRLQIKDARNRHNLLSNVRADISAYRAQNPAAAEEEYMLDERERLDASHRVADGVLSQAYAISDSFRTQRETLASVNRRIVGAASQIPGINSLMSRIGSKKRRDGFILGGFIALCFLAVFFLS
jgi:golgi SNAP receptor complex member 1